MYYTNNIDKILIWLKIQEPNLLKFNILHVYFAEFITRPFFIIHLSNN